MNQIETVSIGNLTIGSGLPKICVPITGSTKNEVLEQARSIKEKRPDLVEWRGDMFADILEQDTVRVLLTEIKNILEDIPILFTFRTKREGGRRDLSVNEYIELNECVSRMEQVQLVDVEVYMDQARMPELIKMIRDNGKKVIASHHRFDRTPSRYEMLQAYRMMEAAGADILKLAVMPLEHTDLNDIFLAANEALCDHVHHPVVAIAMGNIGVQSRISGELFGSSMTFACVGEASAPGQMEIDELRIAMQEIHMLVEKF